MQEGLAKLHGGGSGAKLALVSEAMDAAASLSRSPSKATLSRCARNRIPPLILFYLQIADCTESFALALHDAQRPHSLAKDWLIESPRAAAAALPQSRGSCLGNMDMLH